MDQEVSVALLPLKLSRPTNVHIPLGLADSNALQLDVVGGIVFEPTVGLIDSLAAHTPVQGAPAPAFGIAVVAAELIVVFTKFEPLLLVPELNRLMTLAFGALRFSSRSPSNDSVAL